MFRTGMGVNPVGSGGGNSRSDDTSVGAIDLDHSLRRLKQRQRLRQVYQQNYEQPHQTQRQVTTNNGSIFPQYRQQYPANGHVNVLCNDFDTSKSHIDYQPNTFNVSSNSSNKVLANKMLFEKNIAADPESLVRKRMKWNVDTNERNEPLIVEEKSPTTPQ
eukprot:5538817-Ditylum_brightwellii.AAC.1